MSLARLSQLSPDEVCAVAEPHGVIPLLAQRCTEQRIDSPLARQLRAQTRRHAAGDLVRDAELRSLITHLNAAGVHALLVKGVQLAYDHYERADLRPRMDTDLFIEASERDRAHDVLTGLDYEPQLQSDGDLLMYQRPYVKLRDGAVAHVVDLHWRVVNPQQFDGVLDYGEAAAGATAIRSLDGARGLGPTHALLLACVHRVAHHYGSESLIWLYDVHLLSGRMTPKDWTEFMAMAAERGVDAVCRQGLMLAHGRFGSPVPMALLDSARRAGRPERSAIYMAPQRHVTRVYWDLQALPGWTARWRLVRQHLFPPALYMRTVYAPSSHAPLPVLYAMRALRGARKWMVRQ